MDGVAPTALLDDSDFFEERQRQELIRKKKQEKLILRKISGRSPAKRRTNNVITSFSNLPEARAFKGESHTHLGTRQHLRGSVEAEKITPISKLMDDEPDERYVIDVRYLKAIPAFERDYYAECADDVLPEKKIKEKADMERREKERLQKTRLKLEYKITGLDEKKARERLDSYYSKSASHASIIGTRKSRRFRDDESIMEPQLSRSVVEKEFDTNTSKQTLRRNSTKSFTKKKTFNPGTQHHTTSRPTANRPGAAANDEDYFKQEKINDYIEVYKWMERPLPNELAMDNPESQNEKLKEFDFEEDFKSIRRKDLKEGKISENNWSGDNILMQSNAHFAVDRVKRSLNIQDYDIWRTGYWGVWHGLRRTCKAFTESAFFNSVIMISVLLNTIILATEGLITDTSTQDLLSTFNFVFTVIFTVEMGLKLTGLGIEGYIMDRMNLFDAAVVIISLVEEIFLTGGGNKAVSAFRTVRLFRTFRVLRVTKLLRSLKYMQVIIVVIGRSMRKFIYILILLFLFVFIYTLLGMQLFGGGLSLSDNTGQDRTRQNFDTFMNAFMTSFQIMSQENWQQILFLAIRSEAVNTLISILYLVSWIWIGNYIFLNLFLAILLDEFTVEDVSEEFDELKEDDGSNTFSSTTRSQTFDKSDKMGTQKTLSKDSSHPKTANSSRAAMEEDEEDEESARQIKNDRTAIMICEKSLYIFSKQNIIRRICLKMIQHPWFERMILTMIVLSSIKLAFDTYFDDDSNDVIEVSDKIDVGLNVFFAVEALMKIISLGLFVDNGCYLRDSWNKLDLIIVIASILDMSFENIDLSFIRILRLLRTLRPLRFITHNKSMKLIVTALIESVSAILNVIIVVVLIWLMFAILAVNIVGGKLGYCGGLPASDLYYSIGVGACPGKGGVWTNPHVNFDNVFQAMISLFILSTQEGWPDIMYTVVDANDASEGPIEGNQRLFAYIYFIVFIFVGSYFLVNLFIGVIFLEFTKAEKRENHLKKFLTPQQQNWVMMQRLLLAVKPDVSGVEPKSKFMRKVFRIINHTRFEIFIMSVIVLNILLMAITYEGSSESYNTVLKYINWCFSGIFFIELVLKHLGLGFKRFWEGGWNRFDAFVVFASALDILMDVMQQSFFSFIRIGPQLARVFRVLRVSRLLKLVKQFEGLQKMLNTLVFTLPSLLNVGALLFLVYFIYSILATYLFNSISKGARIDDYVHFQNFGTAIVTLFRCSTGEDWFIIMFDTLYPQMCTDGTDTCGTWAAYLFWISFIIVCQFIFLNLFILVILQQFEEYHLNDDNPVNAFTMLMDNHIKPTWEELAKKHGGTHIHENQLTEFFCKFNYPYGYKNSHESKAGISREVMHLNIPEDERSMVYYNDIIYILLKNGFYNVQKDLIMDGKLEVTDDQTDYILMQEDKTRRKLEGLKKTLRPATLRRKSTIKELTKTKKVNTANPIPRILFMGMTMRAWITYAHRISEKMKAAQENGYEYIESESDQDDYTFDNSDKSSESGSDNEQGSLKKLSGYIKEEVEAESSDDMEKERINTEQQSLIDIENTDRKRQLEEKEYIFNGDVSPAAQDEEAGPSYNVANLNFRAKNRRPRNQDGTKITITSHSSLKGGSHYELEKNKSASRLTPQKLIKFVEGGDYSDLPAKASYSFLDPDVSPKKFESKKNSKNTLEDAEKANVINFNINNNVVINNNYFYNTQPPVENGEVVQSPISRETSITIERNISVNRAPARRNENANQRMIATSSRDLEEGGLAIPDSKDTPSSKKSTLSK